MTKICIFVLYTKNSQNQKEVILNFKLGQGDDEALHTRNTNNR